MDIIMAIDLKNKCVVHGIMGEREKYKSATSYLFNKPTLSNVIKETNEELGINKFYVADLDAIEGCGNNINEIENIISRHKNIEVYLDSGISNRSKAEYYLRKGISKVIIGTETLTSLEDLFEIVQNIPKYKIIVSIDTIDGKMLSKCTSIKSMDVIEVISTIKNMGIKNIILLDIKKVGTESGYKKEQFNKIQQCSNNMNIFIGGGIRNIDDVIYFKEQSINGVIVATAIYNGKINRDNIKQIYI